MRGQRLVVGSCQEQERFDDLAKVLGLALDDRQHPLVFLDVSILPQREFNLPEDGGQWGSQLVRSVAREPALAFEGS